MNLSFQRLLVHLRRQAFVCSPIQQKIDSQFEKGSNPAPGPAIYFPPIQKVESQIAKGLCSTSHPGIHVSRIRKNCYYISKDICVQLRVPGFNSHLYDKSKFSGFKRFLCAFGSPGSFCTCTEKVISRT